MSLVTPNFEEAATIASEFIYSLDNLPNEVSHLLQEIKHRETRAQELQQDIDKDSAKYVRHSLRAANATPSTPSSRAASPKSSLLPAKIAAHYAEIQELSSEKCLLAQRLIDLITLSRARLDSDLVKVRILQGETIEPPSVSKATIGESLTASVRNPALAHATESLRVALASAASPDARAAYGSPTPTTASATVGGSVTKKRRITASLKASPTASPLKGRSASPASAATPHTAHPRSRLSRQIHLAEPEEVDMDAEGEEDDEDAEGEDTKLYCFCQKQSFGDMIACDNEGGCPYEWFHLSCIGMKQPLPEKWYCSECKPKMTGATFSRKGRKK